MNRILISLIFLFALPWIEPKAYAQASALSKGDRVRVRTLHFVHPTMVGAFERIDADTLFLHSGDGSFAIPLGKIQRLEKSRGVKRHTMTGMVAGVIFGGLIGGVSFHAAAQNVGGYGKIGQPGIGGGLVIGALLGGAAGALTGHQIRSDRWQQVSLRREPFHP